VLPTTVVVLQAGPFGKASGENPFQSPAPPWFVAAEGASDSHLSRAEFNGPAEDFQRLDANQDGWIDADEANVK
jgi:hypothetical protein